MDQRIEFCCKALREGNFRALCRGYGISAKTGYKWQERFLRDGANGMAEESRRPRSHPESLGEEELCRIVGLKLAHPNWGPRKIRELYQRRHGRAASESSFKRVLERSGLTQKRKVRLASQSGRLCSGRQAQEPNQVWTVDFKGWWYNGSQRCEPLTVPDEYSRYLLELRALENARSETVQKSFEGLFERYGLPEAMRSDNGSPFASRGAVHGLSRLSAWWVALGIDLERGRPGHPQDNGATNACIAISAWSSNVWAESIRIAWNCGARSLTSNAPMRPLGCGVRANFISIPLANIAAESSPERQTLGSGVDWLQLATYPQSPFSGPVRCCDVKDLYQAFRAAHRPGAIMDKSERPFCCSFWVPPKPPDRYPIFYTRQQP
jgi:transposase InsO family protein